MRSTEKEVQKVLQKKLMKGPQFHMNEEGTMGINYVSGNQSSVFYELYGKNQIYQMVIMKPSTSFYTNQYVGRLYLLVLLIEEDKQMHGGFVSGVEQVHKEFQKSFPHLSGDEIEELQYLWTTFVVHHYTTDLEVE
ncbi:hypothetical protein [Metabacillus fastidiosus]|uniref:hypothetical protein n=1 Tax=Metabacillus fastidiosus TaxID=1458 RepID=UPI002DBFBBF7|nr:hypothetical protein [Metabacillus fastidiosus]MEC2076112.1 hypothetical protein [Metabacillus fastidiosus]